MAMERSLQQIFFSITAFQGRAECFLLCQSVVVIQTGSSLSAVSGRQKALGAKRVSGVILNHFNN